MDKTILIPSVIIAVIMIAIYLIRCWLSEIEANNAVLVSSIMNSSGIVCGIALALSPFFPTIKDLIGGIDIYIVIGGFAVLFVSCQAIHKDVIKSTRRDTLNNSMQEPADVSAD